MQQLVSLKDTTHWDMFEATLIPIVLALRYESRVTPHRPCLMDHHYATPKEKFIARSLESGKERGLLSQTAVGNRA